MRICLIFCPTLGFPNTWFFKNGPYDGDRTVVVQARFFDQLFQFGKVLRLTEGKHVRKYVEKNMTFAVTSHMYNMYHVSICLPY